MPEALTINKLTPQIGAEILGVDLTRLSKGLAETIRKALLDNLVIFFRDQKLNYDQLKAFGREFGKLHIHPVALPPIPEHPEIIIIETDEKSTNVAGELWHSDASADTEPPLGSVLYMKVVPENGGGDTLFANTYAVYEALSAPMKKFLDGLTAIHDGERLRGRYGIRNTNERLAQAEHPVVRTHPETRAKAGSLTRNSPLR